MKPFYQTAVIGLMLLAAAAPVYAASTLRFSLSVISVSEATGHATVHVLRSGDLDTAVTVDYATTAQSATAALDYTDTSGTVAFGSGETVKAITIPILNDELRESTETFLLTLSGPGAGAVLVSPSQATLRIHDNDFGVSWAQPAHFIAEEAGEIRATVVRGNDLDLRAFTVDYALVAGTTTEGADYVAQSGTLSFADGELSRELRIVVANDGLAEVNESFRVTLANAVGGPTLGSLRGTQITIRDNDGGVSFATSGMTVSEHVGEAVLTVVRRTDLPLIAFTVDFTTADVSATAGVDYMTRSGTLSFAAGQLTDIPGHESDFAACVIDWLLAHPKP